MEARRYPTLHFFQVISPSTRFQHHWQVYVDLACQDEVPSSPPCFHKSNPKAGIQQKITYGSITAAQHEKDGNHLR